DKANRALVGTQPVRRVTARDEQYIEVVGSHIVEGIVGRSRDFPSVAGELHPRLETNNGYLVTSLGKGFVRFLELTVLETLRQNASNARHDSLLGLSLRVPFVQTVNGDGGAARARPNPKEAIRWASQQRSNSFSTSFRRTPTWRPCALAI